IFILCLSNIEYFNAHKYEWKKLGGLFGVKTSVMGVADFDLVATAATIEQAIAKKPKGICLFGVDPSLNASIDKAVDAGVPVVSIIGDQKGSKETAYIGSSGEDLGYLGGKKLAEAIGEKGKVAILSIPGNEQWDIREAGYRKALAEYPDISVVAVGDTKADAVTAAQAAKDILVRFPDLAGFAGCDSTAAMGAATAVQEANMAGKVKIIGMDRNADELAKIEQGVITGTIAQNDAAMMYWALLTLMSKNVYSPELTSDNQKAGVIVEPSIIYLPPNYVDKSNLQYFLEADKTYASEN
ncbi:MAG TPA: substrate-binding domain-containing protein, partial [Syntrophomonas sp.]|nr:substrate-binding domain-containing protein [Syntrophomonas sp.]